MNCISLAALGSINSLYVMILQSYDMQRGALMDGVITTTIRTAALSLSRLSITSSVSPQLRAHQQINLAIFLKSYSILLLNMLQYMTSSDSVSGLR